MEEEPPTPEELSEVYKKLFDFPYESLSPQAAVVGAHQAVTPNEFCIQQTRATASRNVNIGTGSG